MKHKGTKMVRQPSPDEAMLAATHDEVIDTLAAVRASSDSPEFMATFRCAVERAEVAHELQRVVDAHGVGLRELARRMKTSPSQVQRLLNTSRNGSATVDTLTKFARATGTQMCVLLESEAERAVRLAVLGDRNNPAESVRVLMTNVMSFVSVQNHATTTYNVRIGAPEAAQAPDWSGEQNRLRTKVLYQPREAEAVPA
jgi:transcriptional regulator with XRE-family HTH domain